MNGDGNNAMGGLGYDPRNPVTIKVWADPGAQQCFKMMLVAKEMGQFSGKMVHIEMDSGDGEEMQVWTFQVRPKNFALYWELQLDAVKEMLEKMGVNFKELKPFNFMRSCGFPDDPEQREQREGYEVIRMDSHCVEAGNGVKFEFLIDKLTIEEGKQVGRHSHGKNVVFEIYFYQEAPFHADVCAFGEAHESRPGMRHVIALKMILCK